MTTPMRLSELTNDHRPSAGGKAATLGTLAQSGFAVPDGVVLDTRWHADWLSGRLDRSALARALANALATLGGGPLVVRSSGVAEDGAISSMAGYFTSTLGVTTVESAVEAVLACYASARDARDTLGIDVGGMAVLLQLQVDARAAGAAFTANPVTGARDVVCIEAVRGLGEALMAGEADGEVWRVTDRAHRESAGPPVLDPAIATEIASAARRVEQVLGFPVDVEWVYDGHAVQVVQARAITALPAAPIPIEEPDPPGSWTRDDHAPVMTPLMWHAWMTVYPGYLTRCFKEAGLPVERMEARLIRGQVYSRVVVGGGGPPPPGWVLWLVSRLLPSFRRAEASCQGFITERPYLAAFERWDTTWEPELAARARALIEVDLDEVSDDALVLHLRDCIALLHRGGDIHAELGFGHVSAVGILHVTAEDELGWTDAETAELLAGWSGSTTEVDRTLAEIGVRWADDPRLHRGTWAEVLTALPELAAAIDTWSQWEGLRRRDYTATAKTYAECTGLILDRLRDAPALLERLDSTRARQLARSEARLQEALDQLPPARREAFARIVTEARAGLDNRDRNALVCNQIPASLVCRAAREIGHRLVKRGELGAPDHAFFLEPDEWEPALAGVAVADQVVRRRGHHSWALANPGPQHLGPPEAPPDPGWFPPALRTFFRIIGRMDPPPPTGDGVRGLAGGGGVVEGTVRVIRHPRELHRLRTGDVLVCPSTGASWAPAYGTAGAVVTDLGGYLSHPAILAREYGLPAVLGTSNATDRLVDGQRVRVDGSNGTVEVL